MCRHENKVLQYNRENSVKPVELLGDPDTHPVNIPKGIKVHTTMLIIISITVESAYVLING